MRRWPQLLTDFLTGYLDWFEGHKLVWMLSNQVMALYRASLVILFVGVWHSSETLAPVINRLFNGLFGLV